MQYLITACAGYRVEYGDWPRGDVAQIIKTLHGANPRRIPFLEVEPRFMSPQGEVLDGWGTALRITMGGERISVASAGKDRSFGTEDDLTLSKP